MAPNGRFLKREVSRVRSPRQSGTLAFFNEHGNVWDMGIEIERKFLIREGYENKWKGDSGGTPFVQGYLCKERGRTIRVRIAGQKAFLTIKGEVHGISRPEFEYEVPLNDASAMLLLCEGPLVEKTRHLVSHEGHLWEVDVFGGKNAGLIVAEIELDDVEQQVPLPEWVGQEVTGDIRYYNSSLSRHPFGEWKAS
jgi:adenylate cyclase